MSSLEERQRVLTLIAQAVADGARQDRACAVIGLSARSVQRWQRAGEVGHDRRTLRHWTPPHRLTPEERSAVLSVANSAEFGHLPPSQIVPRLADQGRYLASEATFYRVLKAENQLAHRHAERAGQARSKPKAICATAPNRLYSWDITYLPSAIRGQFFYLYLFLDLFSRKIVGWQVHDEENNTLASEVLKDLCQRESIVPDQVILHSDNGGAMKGATMLATLQTLGVRPSFSRPAVSNDNPFSEALFRTLKYRPEYPTKPFDDVQQARLWVEQFVGWYNHEHRHSGIRFVTPAQRHAGLDAAILQQRKRIYETARTRNPQRWSGSTRNWQRVEEVHLNPDRANSKTTKPKEEAEAMRQAA